MNNKIKLTINTSIITIWVNPVIKAYYNDQIVRNKPSVLQRKLYTTVHQLMRAAYLQGKKDASKIN